MKDISEFVNESFYSLAENYVVKGLGNDLVCLSSFKQSFNSQYIKRVFTQNEINYCEQFDEPMLRYASTWAAKEAVYKALKQVIPDLKIWWPAIEIMRNKPQGKPQVKIHKTIPPLSISLSITHDGDYVWAIATCSTAC